MLSFETLYESSRPALWRAALSLNFGNRDDAEDLLQDCVAQALENFERFDHKQPFEKWATCILHNLHKNCLKSGERSRTETVGLAGARVFRRPDPSSPNENCFAMLDAIERLPDYKRNPMVGLLIGEPPASRSEITLRYMARQSLKEALR